MAGLSPHILQQVDDELYAICLRANDEANRFVVSRGHAPLPPPQRPSQALAQRQIHIARGGPKRPDCHRARQEEQAGG